MKMELQCRLIFVIVVLVLGNLQLSGCITVDEVKNADISDGNFNVSVHVTKFGAKANLSQKISLDQTLHLPSTVLMIHVHPRLINTTSIKEKINSESSIVKISIFDQENQNTMILDDHQSFASPYTVNIGTAVREILLQIYLELAIEVHNFEINKTEVVRKHAMSKRSLNLSPTIPNYLSCSRDVPVVMHPTVPPPLIPIELCDGYTNQGKIPVSKWYFDDQSNPGKSYVHRSLEEIDELISEASKRKTYYYGMTDSYLYNAMDKFNIEGMRVLIMGSNIPWYESICVAFKAAECVTVDYNKLHYNHPMLKTYTVEEFSHLPNTSKLFDRILSISSFEHDGLGRYGDPLDPFGDFKAMQNMKKYTTANTIVFLAVPVGKDAVVWNAQRIYGSIRLPQLLKGWDLIDSFGFSNANFEAEFSLDHQPVFVLRNGDHSMNHIEL